MTNITLSKDARTDIAEELQQYFEQELETDLGQFEAEFLIDFISKNIGYHFYNQGLLDAQAILSSKLEFIQEEIDALAQSK